MRLMTLCLIVFLTACQNNPFADRIVEVYPPAEYLRECRLTYPDRTEHGAIETLSAGVHCERAGKQAARCWIAERKGEKDSPDCVNPTEFPLSCDENHNNRGGDDVGGHTTDGPGACISNDGSANYNPHSSKKVEGNP